MCVCVSVEEAVSSKRLNCVINNGESDFIQLICHYSQHHRFIALKTATIDRKISPKWACLQISSNSFLSFLYLNMFITNNLKRIYDNFVQWNTHNIRVERFFDRLHVINLLNGLRAFDTIIVSISLAVSVLFYVILSIKCSLLFYVRRCVGFLCVCVALAMNLWNRVIAALNYL